MTEGIVLFICLAGNPGCGAATTAYYDNSVYMQHVAQTIEYKANEKIGKEKLAILGTMSGMMIVKKGIVNLYNHVNLVVDDSSAQIQLHWDQ